MAVPRELHEACLANGLAFGLGLGPIIEFHRVLGTLPKPLVLCGSTNQPPAAQNFKIGADARLIACRLLRRCENALSSSGSFFGPIAFPKLKY
jgi:hypothetical protein